MKHVRAVALILAFCFLCTMLPEKVEAATADEINRIKQQITDTYSNALTLSKKSSFDNLCATYVGYQLVSLGILKKYESTSYGSWNYAHYAAQSKTTGGYSVATYPSDSYTIEEALSAINNSYYPYNILIGFRSKQAEYYYDKKLQKEVQRPEGAAGHVAFIHAVLDGVVYLSESGDVKFNGVSYSEGSVIAVSIADYAAKYNSSNKKLECNGIIQFISPDDSLTSPTSTNAIVKAAYSGNVKAAPYADAETLGPVSVGDTFTVGAYGMNKYNNIWYQILEGDYAGGYIFSGDMTLKEYVDDVTIGNLGSVPDSFTYGTGQSVTANIQTRHIVSSATVSILQGNTVHYTKTVTPNVCGPYSLNRSEINSVLFFSRLDPGNYTLKISATVTAILETQKKDSPSGSGYYCHPEKTFTEVYTKNFTVLPAPPVSVTFDDPSSTYASKYGFINDTNAGLVHSVVKPSGTTVSAQGMYLYDANKDTIESCSYGSSTSASTTSYHMWFDVQKEVGCTLTPGTQYYYRFFVVINGATHWSEMYSFKTTGGHTHTYGNWLHNGTQHWKSCSCGATTVTANHTWNSGTVSKAPSYIEEGEMKYTCTICSRIKTEVIPTLTGTNTYRIEDGKTYVFMNNASYLYMAVPSSIDGASNDVKNGRVILAERDYDAEFIKTTAGNDGAWYLYPQAVSSSYHIEVSRVNNTLAEGARISIFALNDASSTDAQFFLRCVKKGVYAILLRADPRLALAPLSAETNTVGSDLYLVKYTGENHQHWKARNATEAWVLEEPAAHDHSPISDWSSNESRHWKICSQCAALMEQADHVWDSGILTTQPTATALGIKTYTCTTCNRTKTESVPATGYTLTVKSADISMGTVIGGGNYAAGTGVTITATPLSGYKFVSWSDGNTDASRNITVYADATYTAIFKKESIPGDVNGNGIIETADALILAKSIAGLLTLTDLQKSAADANVNGILDMLDVILICAAVS